MRELAHLRADSAEVIATVARQLTDCGDRLLAGDWILAGSVIHVPVAAGDRIVAAIDGLGEVSVAIAA